MPDQENLFNPTSFLPPLRRVPAFAALQQGLRLVTKLYASASPSESLNLEHFGKAASGRSSTEQLQDAFDAARRDEIEKRFALDWCLRIIASDLTWLSEGEAQTAQDVASSVIAAEAALAEAGPLERLFRFPLDSPTIEINIRDAPLPISKRDSTESVAGSRDSASEDEEEPDGYHTPRSNRHISSRKQNAATAVGVQTWGSASILCDLFARHADDVFAGLDLPAPSMQKPFRILELGSGTGLVGLFAASLAQRARLQPVEVCLTDYHEKVLENLQHNIGLNCNAHQTASVGSAVLDWRDVHDVIQQRQRRSPSPSSQSSWWSNAQAAFSLILAADVIYSPEHPAWLLSNLRFFLSHQPHSRAHIMCPIRLNGRFGEWNLLQIADRVFGQAHESNIHTANPEPGASESAEKEVVLLQRTELPKIKGIGREDESGYVYWVFGRR
ncbi:hypothetical protein K437DRAFT_258307 [Tilletiaria anomala UBC 951]|uniref:S-adenosyl-L-methionine-dependent methyltransferase n=1 Tax=Tilletiaria anomala (strain ATCC 24038 / CBS 436.72 / UBC 951) TaxID=1037660 RepID=A0A066VRX9_TILAU|nr:uncharacterized protein K437DRAFT_258307 [Tilletiaria anomala UBC 951]KDN41320.1 hypothetical protein K437DRAFT_258307 [Tilletiaria anomala UBC 951]